jgi:acetyl esterase/lipase
VTYVRLRFAPLVSALVISVAASAAASKQLAQEPPSPTQANIAYAPADPPGSRGHLLDLYLPAKVAKPVPVVIYIGGSAWKSDNDKVKAERVAAELNKAGLAVAGVSTRSSAQTKFPGQLYDVKAAIRWLRANASRHNLDPDNIAIMGSSSGAWTAVMAAVTGNRPELEGTVGTPGVSSSVQAAVAFYPPTDFLAMGGRHDDARSPESRLIGCAIKTCPEKAEAANPVRYVRGGEPPIMLLHGEQDAKVPYSQSELLYEALKKSCDEAMFISLPNGGHGQQIEFLTGDAVREGATLRSTSAGDCKVTEATAVTPSWKTVTEFLDRHLRGRPGGKSHAAR